MKKLLGFMNYKNIQTGYLYFYIHLITEITCFYFLNVITNGSNIIWLIPFFYDGMAFVPQSIIGYIKDKHPKINFSIIGTILLFISILIYYIFNINVFIPLTVLCLGNALIHINGAEVTLKSSDGKLSHSAIFVAGGSFGVVLGKLFAKINISYFIILLLILTMIPFIFLAEKYKTFKDNLCEKFDYVKTNLNKYMVIIFAVLVVIIRGYIGYGIPTSWNKTTFQTVLLFSTMGIGKALGGILSDSFGLRKIAILSTLLSIPFLCFGDNYMFISLFGVLLFSMTMSITLALLVSVLKKNPSLAFGLTTIGLFLGTAPIFFVDITSEIFNLFLIVIVSLLCMILLLTLLKKEVKYD